MPSLRFCVMRMCFQVILAAWAAIEMPNLIGRRFFQHGFYRSSERRLRHLCSQYFGRVFL